MRYIGIALNFFLLISFLPAKAQDILCEPNRNNSGTVVFNATYRIDTTVAVKPLADPSKDITLQGFRVQVFFGNDRNAAQNLKAQLANQYPQLPVYLIYEQPYFKVRVGDFRTRLEAMATHKELKNRFSETLIVQDKINFPTFEQNP